MVDGSSFILVCVSIGIVGILLIVVMTLTKRSAPQLDVNKYRMKWLSLETQLSKSDDSSHQLVVLGADKLLDQALRESGIKGTTMGERMKTAKETWSDANAVWAAHKIRNKIAHEADVQVSHAEARRALTSFKQALKDLGAI